MNIKRIISLKEIKNIWIKSTFAQAKWNQFSMDEIQTILLL